MCHKYQLLGSFVFINLKIIKRKHAQHFSECQTYMNLTLRFICNIFYRLFYFDQYLDQIHREIHLQKILRTGCCDKTASENDFNKEK